VIQAIYLPTDLEGIKIGDAALAQQQADLAMKHTEVKAEGTESYLQKAKAAAAKAGVVQPVSSSAAPEDPAVLKEKQILAKLLLVQALKLEVFKKKRQEKRAVAAVIQVIVEDVPITIVNVLFLVYSCSLGFLGNEEGEMSIDDDGGCDAALDKGAMVTFILITVATTALMTKKITDALALKDVKRQVNTIEQVQIPALLAQARALIEGGGGDLQSQLRAVTERAAQQEKELGVLRRRVRGLEGAD
jgi:hypothetical protein